MFGPIRTAALKKFWIDDLFGGFLRRRPARVLAHRRLGRSGTWWTACSTSVSAWTLVLGDQLRRIQTGRAQDYVYGVAVGILVLVLLMKLVWA